MEQSKEEIRILEHSAAYKVPSTISREEAWDRISDKIGENNKTRSLFFNTMKWAASITLLITAAVFILYIAGQKQISNLEENFMEFELPDGSKVALNTESSISFNSILWSFDRGVDLEGIAFFEVEKGSVFSVHTQNANVEVLGTKFNIYSSNKKFKVACYEGKVRVSSPETEQKVILTQGLATQLLNKELTNPYLFNKDKELAWKNGLFYFEKESLSEVFDEIMDHYNVLIEYDDDLSNEKFSGVFNQGELNNVMEIVCSSMGLKYEIQKEKIIIL